MEYDPEEYYSAIKYQFEDSESWPAIDQTFGEIFVDLYRTAQSEKEVAIDPKVLKLEKSAGLLDTLRYFEPYIKDQAQKLFTKLSKKITQQGTGKLI
jgi:hypothetical protein